MDYLVINVKGCGLGSLFAMTFRGHNKKVKVQQKATDWHKGMLRLPAEVLARICEYLRDVDLVNLAQTNRQLLVLARQPSCWRWRCEKWRHWQDPSLLRRSRGHFRDDKDDDENSHSQPDWHQIYIRKTVVDRTVVSLLEQYSGYASYSSIFYDIVSLGVDALDVLDFVLSVSSLDNLGAKFIANEAQGFIRRQHAVHLFLSSAAPGSTLDQELVFASPAYFHESDHCEQVIFMDDAAEYVASRLSRASDPDSYTAAQLIIDLLLDKGLLALSDSEFFDYVYVIF